MSLRVAVDFDGTLASNNASSLVLRPGAAQAIMAFKRLGHFLILHSCRCNPVDESPTTVEDAAAFYAEGKAPAQVLEQWGRFDEMRTFLTAQGLWALFDEVWQRPGKPMADIYIDDRAERPDWQRLVRELGAST